MIKHAFTVIQNREKLPGNDSFSKGQGTVYAVQGSGRTL